jgi:hypothetical protein
MCQPARAMNEGIHLAVWVLLPVVFTASLIFFIRRIRRGQPSKRWAVIAANVVVFLLLVSSVFLAGEAYFRYWYDTTDPLHYSKVGRRWFGRHYRYNSSGIRDNIQYDDRLTPGQRRITFLGDSFTVGHGVRDVNNRFANLIRQTDRQAEVHLLAKDGFDTGAEIEALQQAQHRGYQVDAVVLVYCLNDISDLMPEWTNVLHRVRNLAEKESPWLESSYFADTLYYRLTVGRDPDVANYFGFVKDAYSGPTWERQRTRLQTLRDQVQAAGGRFLAVTFPFLHMLGTNYEYKFAHDRLEGLWRELGVAHLDLLKVYQDIAPHELVVNRYDAHPNEYAHALAAEAIAKFLKEEVADKPAGQ